MKIMMNNVFTSCVLSPLCLGSSATLTRKDVNKVEGKKLFKESMNKREKNAEKNSLELAQKDERR